MDIFLALIKQYFQTIIQDEAFCPLKYSNIEDA